MSGLIVQVFGLYAWVERDGRYAAVHERTWADAMRRIQSESSCDTTVLVRGVRLDESDLLSIGQHMGWSL